MNVVQWWKDLPRDWEKEHRKQCVICNRGGARCKPLTWKQLFFRDKVAVITNVGFALVWIVLVALVAVGVIA